MSSNTDSKDELVRPFEATLTMPHPLDPANQSITIVIKGHMTKPPHDKTVADLAGMWLFEPQKLHEFMEGISEKMVEAYGENLMQIAAGIEAGLPEEEAEDTATSNTIH